MRKLVSFLCTVGLLLAVLPANVSALEANPVLKIGLYYGNNALPSANLQNKTGFGQGYYWGYFDDSRTFHTVGETDEIFLTIMKDKNIYLANDDKYYDVMPANQKGVVGAYHLQISNTYSSFEEMKPLIAQISAFGLTAFPAYINGSYFIRIGSYGTSAAATADIPNVSQITGNTSLQVVGASATCYTVTKTETTAILFEFDMGGQSFGVYPKSNGTDVQTWFKGYTYRGGFEYRRANGNDITVINLVTMQEYLKGVIPWEMNANWPIEALKAQALCAKSFALTSSSKHKSYGFDLCATTDCQVYQGTKSATANSDQAVDATFGIYIMYNGAPAQTYYHSSNGGATEDVKNIWGSDIPYLKGVIDNFEDLENAINGIWHSEFSPETATAILQSKGEDIGSIVDIIPTYSAVGNVIKLTFVDSSGKTLTFTKDKVRTILNSTTYGVSTHSHHFTIGSQTNVYVNDQTMQGALSGSVAIGSGGNLKNITQDSSSIMLISGSGLSTLPKSNGNFVIDGKGWGHNVGMSQNGALGMAKQGYTYDQIIKFYFTGVDVAPMQ